jgi:DNA-binding transcriptional MerR regulator
MEKAAAQNQRVYYSIGEVAQMFKVNTSLIRFWEKEFAIIKPHKNKKGNRLFTPRDIDNFHKIYHLVKERGFTLQGAKDALKAKPEQVDRDFEISRTLDNMKTFLLDVKKHF